MHDEHNSKPGYGRPPGHTQFRRGQSGNPSGRPKKKGTTFLESLERELNIRITVVEGGTRRKITKLDAIVKQQTNKAVTGDVKATALLLSLIEKRESDATDAISPMLQAMRAIHAKHETAKPSDGRTNHDED